MSKGKEYLENQELEKLEKVEEVVEVPANENIITETARRIRIMKRADIVMGALILVVIIIILLLRGCQGGDPTHVTVDIPGNIIDPIPPVIVPEGTLSFNTEDGNTNLPFDVDDMKEGSSETMNYHIVVTHNSDFILNFDMEIRDEEEFQKLAEILKIKVELNGNTVLYDGLLKDMQTLIVELKADEEISVEYVFTVTVYLDSLFTDEYLNKTLVADMSWWIEGQDILTVANNKFVTVKPVVPPVEPPEPVTELNFFTKNEDDNNSFDVIGMKDGDIKVKYFAIEVIHEETVEMIVDSTTSRDSGLSEVLNVKVVLVGGVKDLVLYDGLLDKLYINYTVKENSKGVTQLYFKIIVEAEGLTEDYWDTRYKCSFVWSLKDTSCELKVPNNNFVAYKKPYVPPITPPVTATSIELTAKEGYDNIPFNVENMLPGDSVSQYYCVTVTHDSKEIVCFSTLVDTNQKLSNVLRIKIEHLIPDDEDIVLYDGLMKDCTEVNIEIPSNKKDKTEIYYRITVYTNGSEVGNEYVGESLDADFVWQIQ